MLKFVLLFLAIIVGILFYKNHFRINKPVEIYLTSAINNQFVIKGCLLQNLFGDVMVRVNDEFCKESKGNETLVIPWSNIVYLKIKPK